MERAVFYNKVKPVGVRKNCMVENHAMSAMALPVRRTARTQQ
jgi:hypothetical protein